MATRDRSPSAAFVQYVRNTTARAFAVVASALGIHSLLPFLKVRVRFWSSSRSVIAERTRLIHVHTGTSGFWGGLFLSLLLFSFLRAGRVSEQALVAGASHGHQNRAADRHSHGSVSSLLSLADHCLCVCLSVCMRAFLHLLSRTPLPSVRAHLLAHCSGCAILPHLRSLVEIIEHGLADEQSKGQSSILGPRALSLSGSASASALCIWLSGSVSPL